MVRIVCIGSLVLAAVTAVSGHVIRWKHKAPPKYWETEILEPYDVYHERYLNWGCDKHHSTPVFDQCCHPLLKNECIDVLEDRGCPSPSGAKAASYPSASPLSPPTSSSPEKSKPNPVKPAYAEPAYIKPPTVEPSTTHTNTTTTIKPATSSSPATGGDGGFYTGGIATWFLQNHNAGACGTVHSDNDLIVALDYRMYGDTSSKSQYCGRQVKIYNVDDESKSVTATVADACPTCQNKYSVDCSQGTFTQLGSADKGTFPIKWKFVD